MDFRGIIEFFRDIFKYIIVIIVVFVLVLYVVTLQQVVGPSMNPNYHDGDVLVLSKIHYKIFSIKRNDVISFSYKNTKYLIKRVIGLPGETIEYKDNILYINGVSYKETIVDDLVTEDFTLKDISGYDVIPDNMYLVLGDNRGDSIDSRIIGLIDKSDIIGKAIFQVWPIARFGFA